MPTYFAKDIYTGDGSTTDFSVTFPYILQSHVKVYLDSTEKTEGTDYTWFTASVIRFTVAPAVGVEVKIQRFSNQSARLVDFQDGSILNEKTLDKDGNQCFYISQEAIDAAVGAVAGAHDHNDIYYTEGEVDTLLAGKEPIFSKNTGFNKNFGTGSGDVSQGNHLHAGVYEPVISKNTGFNKNFGIIAGTVSEGNHTHGSTSFKGCLMYTAAGQNITTGTWTVLSNFTSELYDTDGFHDTVTNKSRITIPVGVYKGQFYMWCRFDPNATGVRKIRLLKNGVAIGSPQVQEVRNNTGGTHHLYMGCMSPVISLTATDYYEMEVYQDSGSTLQVGIATWGMTVFD